MKFDEDRDDALLARVRAAGEEIGLAPDARARIARRLERGATGATTLREERRRAMPRIGAWAAAAATVVIAVLVWPMLDRSTTVSAAEVLGRTQEALAAGGHGIDVTTYDLDLGGALEQFLPIEQSGRFTVIETVDHDREGRWKVAKLGSDGRVVGAVADDPAAGTRGWYFVLDGRGHLLRAAHATPAPFSFVTLRTFAMRTLIGLMQASNSAALQEIDRGGEPAYAVDVPSGSGANGPIALTRGRAVIARADARLLDFEAEGSIAGRPFTIAFSLRGRTHQAVAPADAFTLVPGPGDQVIELPSSHPADLLSVLGRCLQQ